VSRCVCVCARCAGVSCVNLCVCDGGGAELFANRKIHWATVLRIGAHIAGDRIRILRIRFVQQPSIFSIRFRLIEVAERRRNHR